MDEYEAKKFKVGDKVIIVNPNARYKPCDKNPKKIEKITKTITGYDCYILNGDSKFNWFDDELELAELFRFEKGDIVKLNPDAKLGDFARGKVTDFDEVTVYSGTEEVMFNNNSKIKFNVEYVIGDLSYTERNAVKLKGFGDYWFESALFTLVRRPEKVKEITMSELEKHYGCKVKIVKGDEE